MIVLDTNIISEFQNREPAKALTRWFRLTPKNELFTCAPVFNELLYGAFLRLKRTGSDTLVRAHRKFIENVIDGRVLPFDRQSAEICAELRAQGVATGRTRPAFDAMIAAICIAHGATLATRNASDFEGLDLKLVNPFEAASS